MTAVQFKGFAEGGKSVAAVMFEHKPVAHEFSLSTIDGRSMSLTQLRGRFVLLNFWATWCPPCLAELPSFGELQDHFPASTMTVLAVSSDEQGAAAVVPFTQPMNLPYAVLLDDTGDVSATYGAARLPVTFLINPDGEIIAAFEGVRDWSSQAMLSWIGQQITR